MNAAPPLNEQPEPGVTPLQRSDVLRRRRLDRLVAELEDVGFSFPGPPSLTEAVLTELDYAMRPRIHERRVPTYGAIVAPVGDRDAWQTSTELTITARPFPRVGLAGARLFADGLSSWVIRGVDDHEGPDAADDELVVFDRPAGSERDVVVLAESTAGTIVQRHPSGVVRVAGDFGVLRWDGLEWQHQPPVGDWVASFASCSDPSQVEVVETLLKIAVHDLGSRGIGAILLYRRERPVAGRWAEASHYEPRLPTPPALQVTRAADLAPLVHVLAQIDGAAVFDIDGTLRELGVRLLPEPATESAVEGFGGMRHTTARRYSVDEPDAVVIVVSEDGPVTVMRNGAIHVGA
ncbi:diadenylate cyclase [Dermatobacter hominis]|uniref:diadenylate cyclase n=1 Tax=Dermatobacter hominis TaxID=2884263 RepID=UPI001D107D9B|nr:diadenylate cyclase [Dermatobacter hominis]UDY37373.1 DNA integrity scanning protein DisA nucleotide-binding domain protein [Dermatobacter hominis]